jgi:N-methylhydantoinase B
MPEKAVAGWGKAIIPLSAGVDAGGATSYVLYHWNGLSGGGAVRGRDGLNQIAHMSTLGGLTLPNVESWEQLYPVLIRRHEFRTDGGGAGEYRGGTGVVYEADVLTAADYSFRGEGLYDPSGFGYDGGAAGEAGTLSVTDRNGTSEPPQYSLLRLPPISVSLQSPGGGGIGDPRRRDPALVLRDLRDGVISAAAARDLYGVAFATDGRSVDAAATARLRAAAA